MISQKKRPDLGEHGIWRWNGERWDLVKNAFRGGKAPFDPNESGGLKIRGSCLGQCMVFPLQFVIGSGQKPHRLEVLLADQVALVDFCICECQGGEWVVVESSCQTGCVPICSFSDDPCTDGAFEIGACDCESSPG